MSPELNLPPIPQELGIYLYPRPSGLCVDLSVTRCADVVEGQARVVDTGDGVDRKTGSSALPLVLSLNHTDFSRESLRLFEEGNGM